MLLLVKIITLYQKQNKINFSFTKLAKVKRFVSFCYKLFDHEIKTDDLMSQNLKKRINVSNGDD